MISSEDFVNSFENKWTNQFHNVSSAGFRATWESICESFNSTIDLNKNIGNDFATNQVSKEKVAGRYVLSPNTGTGKTESIIHYAVMSHVLKDHPGMLVVSRQVTECERIAKTINEETGDDNYAVAFHSQQSKVKLEQLKDYKVVIITHEYFYRNHDLRDDIKRKKWEAFFRLNTFKNRALVIIDEAIDLLIDTGIDSDEIARILLVANKVIGFSRHRKNARLLDDVGVLEYISSIFNKLKNHVDNAVTPIYKDLQLETRGLDLRALINVLKTDKDIRYSQMLTGKQDTYMNSIIKENCIASLEKLSNINPSWAYLLKTGNVISWNTATEAFPKEITAVIMDATAPTNELYKLYQSHNKNVHLIQRIEGVRNYSNVTLYISWGHKVGKSIATAENARLLMANLEDTLNTDDDVLIVTHGELESHLLSYTPPFKLEVNHYGNLTGKNTWKDFNVCVGVGLFQKNQSYYKNRHALATTVDRALYEDSEEVKEEYLTIVNSDLAQEVIQAVNRVRCRSVIDTEGNCKETKIYLILPDDKKGHFIADEVVKQMPGIQVDNWVFDSETKQKPKRGKWQKSVEAYLTKELKEINESIEASKIKKELDIPTKRWESLVSKPATNEFIGYLLDTYGISYTKPTPTSRYIFMKTLKG